MHDPTIRSFGIFCRRFATRGRSRSLRSTTRRAERFLRRVRLRSAAAAWIARGLPTDWPAGRPADPPPKSSSAPSSRTRRSSRPVTGSSSPAQVGARDAVAGRRGSARSSNRRWPTCVTGSAKVGATVADAVKTTVFLVDMADYPRMNEVYAAAFADPLPARSAVAGGRAAVRRGVEIEAWAASTPDGGWCRRGPPAMMGAMPGAAAIVFVLIVVIPVLVIMSGAVVAGILWLVAQGRRREDPRGQRAHRACNTVSGRPRRGSPNATRAGPMGRPSCCSVWSGSAAVPGGRHRGS